MNKRKINFALILLLLLNIVPLDTDAQGSKAAINSMAKVLETLGKKNAGSSVYIRTNKDIFETMEDLWFKTYSVDLKNLLLSSRDQALYVQLVQDRTDSIVWEEIYPLKQGIASGHIYLDNALEAGIYWLCAYTSSSVKTKRDQFEDAKRIRIVRNLNELKADKKEKEPSDKGRMPIEFKLFPESGVLLAGVRNRVAFKATSKSGFPVEVSGKVYENDNEIGTFKSLHDGMGSIFIEPLTDKTYSVRLDAPYQSEIHSLPKVDVSGMTFSMISNTDNSLHLKVYNQDTVPRTFYVQVQTRGLPSVIATGEVKDSLLLRLPLIDVPSGISQVTLMNQSGEPVAERLVYVKPNKMIRITTEISKTKAKKRDKIKMKIYARDENGKPVVAQLGATIYDRIYYDPFDNKDIQTHYLISNQIRGLIHNPSYYFDQDNENRHKAMDLLLLTQGWRSYLWSRESLKEIQLNNIPIIEDTIRGQFLPAKGHKDENQQQAIMLFNADQSSSQLTEVSENNIFQITPDNMQLGKDIYIKHFGKPGDHQIAVTNPFQRLNEVKLWKMLKYPYFNTTRDKKVDSTTINLGGRAIKLEEVVVSAKKESVFRDRYIGSLDSLAKYTNNTDRAHGSWLNCPAGDGDELPVEGKTYIIWTGPNPPTSHPFTFNSTNTKRIVYRYPKYTEEELMKMFGVARTKGYYPEKIFYEPDYDVAQATSDDFRNTLLWAPRIITDENGEASIEFYTSDINSVFFGLIEGISDDGSFGKSVFQLRVSQ